MSKRRKCAAAETITVPTEGEAAHFGATIYLAVLAYPLQKESAQRRALVRHMLLWLAKMAVRKNATLRAKMPPKLTWARLRKHEEMLLTDAAFERVRKRLWAGENAFRQWAIGQQVGPFRINIYGAANFGRFGIAVRALALQTLRWELWSLGRKKGSQRVARPVMSEHLATSFAC